MTILCTIDLETREVSIPSGQCIAAYDHNPGFSLDTSSIKIAAQGPNKVRHDYAVDPSTVQIEEETGYITFDWPIPAGVTEMPIGSGFKYGDKGQLIFAVCAEIISGDTISKAWHSDDGIITVVAHLEPESGGGEDPEEEATNAQKIAQLQAATAILQREISGIASGTPPTASSTSEMDPDESTVYINTTDGNWYYWNGSAWQIGGVYGGAVTDTTLSISGAPADAKAVGDALAEKADADDLAAIDERVTSVEDDVDDLEDILNYTASWQELDITKTSGGFTGDVGSAITLNTTSGWNRTSFIPENGVDYEMTFTNKNISTESAYILAVDSENVITAKYGIFPAHSAVVSNIVIMRFENVSAVYVKNNTSAGGPALKVRKRVVTTALSDIESQLDEIADTINSRLAKMQLPVSSGGFSGNVGEAFALTTSTNWKRLTFAPETGKTYKIKYTVQTGVSSGIAYIKSVDDNGIVVADYAIVTDTSQAVEQEIELTFSDTEKTVYVRSNKNYPPEAYGTVTEFDDIQYDVDNVKEKLKYVGDTYVADIPEPINYTDTTFDDVYSAYDDLCLNFPDYITRLSNIGTDADGNAIRRYSLKKNKSIVGYARDWTSGSGGSENNHYGDYCNLKRCLLTSGVHGNEKSAVWGLYMFIRDLLESDESWSAYIENNFFFDIIPVIDPWGYDNNSRNNKNNVNINRDYNTAVESVAKVSTDAIWKCARNWREMASLAGMSAQYYPYAYMCLSVNTGTLPDYLVENQITNKACTIETVKVSGTAQSTVAKITMDLLGALIPAYKKLEDRDL